MVSGGDDLELVFRPLSLLVMSHKTTLGDTLLRHEGRSQACMPCHAYESVAGKRDNSAMLDDMMQKSLTSKLHLTSDLFLV